MQIPGNRDSANVIVERFIGANYTSVKFAGDNLESFSSLPSVLEEFNTFLTNSIGFRDNMLVTRDNLESLQTYAVNSEIEVQNIAVQATNVVSLTTPVLNIESSLDIVNTSLNFDTAIPDVSVRVPVFINLANSTETGSPTRNVLTEMSAIVNEVSSVSANESAVQTVSLNSLSYQTLAVNEQLIQQLVDNLPENQVILANANLIATEAEVVVSLGDTEVTGTTYTSLYDAVEYAKSILQDGGTLTVNVPDGVYGSGGGFIDLESRINLRVIGVPNAQSTATPPLLNATRVSVNRTGTYSTPMINADNVRVELSDVWITFSGSGTDTGGPMFSLNNSEAIFTNSRVSSTGGNRTYFFGDVIGSYLRFDNCWFRSTGRIQVLTAKLSTIIANSCRFEGIALFPSGTPSLELVSLTENCKGIFSNCTFTCNSDSTAPDSAIVVSENTKALVSGSTLEFIDVPFIPAANTDDNLGSRIITA